MTPKRSPASPSEPSPTPLFDFAADSPASTPPSAPTQAPKRGRRPKATRETEPTSAPKSSRTAKKTSSRPTKKAAADAPPQELPPNERPFAVPKNWLWTRLGALGFTNIGLTYKPSDKSEDGVIVLRSSNIQNNKIDYQDIVRVKTTIPESKMCRKGDILICARNGSKALVGKAAIVDQDGMSYGAFMAIFRSEYNRYIFQYLQSPYFRQIIDQDVGTTTINQITQSIIKNLPFPLPPLAEQERIVALVERLFARLDEAAEIVRETLEQIDLTKKALLAQAFRGTLVERLADEGTGAELLKQIEVDKTPLRKADKLKKEKPLPQITDEEKPFEIPEHWTWTRLGNIVAVLGGKRIPAGRTLTEEDTGYKYIRISDMKNGTVLTANLLNVPNDIYPLISKYIINKEDVYITVAGTIGKVGKIPPELDGANLTENADRLVLSSINQDWLIACLESEVVQSQILEATTKVCQPKLAIKRIQNFMIPLPPLAEQARIVALIERQTRKYDEARELAEETAARIETLKKAILARAFRGELGTNDPTDPKPFAPAPTT